jgi:membrane protein implicated in regulation of membrane protease activity
MQYFGIPTCPYCHKKMNVLRIWRIRRHGEYKCPRCDGISNVYLSPLVYVTAILAISFSFLIYFFAKYITDTLSLYTVVEVFIPFVVFYLLSLLFVYLEKPVIRRVMKTEDGKFVDETGKEVKMRELAGVVPVQQKNAVKEYTGMHTNNTSAVRERNITNSNITSGNVQQRNKPLPQRQQMPQYQQKNSEKNNYFEDNEELYNKEAEKIKNNRSVSSDIDEGGNTKEIPSVNYKRPAQSVRSTQTAQKTVSESTSEENYVPVKTAEKRTVRNSGFEDLFDDYKSQPVRPKIKNQQEENGNKSDNYNSKRKSNVKGGSRFREL